MTFLSLPERAGYVTKCESGSRVELCELSVKWVDGPTCIHNISMDVKDGERIQIVGKTGASKTTLLATILGNTTLISGRVSVTGSIAYVPQIPFMLNRSIRDNIIFGLAYERERYESVLNLCCLIEDLSAFENGDETVVAGKGTTLSGGQKQRISIARAIYMDKDIYIVDDCLSAVDSKVASTIFTNVFSKNGALKGKTIIMVTHSMQFLKGVDKVVVMVDGCIDEIGTYTELMESKGTLYKLVKDHGIKEDASKVDAKTKRSLKESKPRPKVVENTKTGSVSSDVYISYAKACGPYSVAILILVLLVSQILSLTQNLVLSQWAADNDSSIETHSPNFWLSCYFGIGVLYAVTIVLQVLIASILCGLKAAKDLHRSMLCNILRQPQRLFDLTPFGELMNRFVKDIQVVDETLPRSFMIYFRTMFSVIVILLLNSIGNPFFMLIATPLGFVYLRVQRFYLLTSRQLKRLEATSRSPVYSHFVETFNGLDSIQANNHCKAFLEENWKRYDESSRAFYCSVSANRWLAVRLGALGSAIVFGSSLLSVLSIHFNSSGLAKSTVGLMIVYSMTITQTLNWMVRQSCDIESNIISVERIQEYTKLRQEAPRELAGDSGLQWPINGEIRFDNYSASYGTDLPMAIKGITAVIKPLEKIGIVGKSGSSKSTLALCLYRIIEAKGGFITIDGCDISKMGLEKLRSSLVMVPQEALLLNGSIRFNVDPQSLASDSEIWLALEKSHIKEYILGLIGGLDYMVIEKGLAFSVGQRGLLCLARAILRKPTILILDESTAAVDLRTEALIQQTIKEEFSGSTILTIAHRISTILSCDKIMVLEMGEIVEFRETKTLLADKTSYFYAMAKESISTNTVP